MNKRNRKSDITPPSIATMVLSLYSAGQHDPQLIRMALLRESPFITLACIKDILAAAHVIDSKKKESNKPKKHSEIEDLALQIQHCCQSCPYKRCGLPCVLPQSLCPHPDAESLYQKWAQKEFERRQRRYLLAAKISIDDKHSAPVMRASRVVMTGRITQRLNIYDSLEGLRFAEGPSFEDVMDDYVDDFGDDEASSAIIEGGGLELEDEEFQFCTEAPGQNNEYNLPISFLTDEEKYDTAEEEDEPPDLISAIASAKSESVFWIDDYADVFSDFLIGLGNLPG